MFFLASTLLFNNKNVKKEWFSSNTSVIMTTSREDCVRAVLLSDQGRTQREVAQDLGLSQSAVYRLLKRYRETNSFERRPGTGKKKVYNSDR